MLDKKRPHGTIWGESHARYSQDGKFFNGQGYEVDIETGILIEGPDEGAATAEVEPPKSAEVKQKRAYVRAAEKQKTDAAAAAASTEAAQAASQNADAQRAEQEIGE